MSNNNNSGSVVNFLELLLVAFIVLKLMGNITWSWWWVMSPFWIPVLLAFLFAGGFSIYLMLGGKK